MSNFTKSLLAFAVVGALAGLLAFFNFTPFHNAVVQLAGSSASGATNTSQRGLGIAGWTLSNGATSTSILNTSAQDVVVTGCVIQSENATTSYTAVTGAGLASLNIKAATTSTNAPAVVSNTNYVLNMNIATGTNAAGGTPYPQIFAATSTLSTTTPTGLNLFANGNLGASAYQFVVPSGAYLTFFSNATSSATFSVFCPILSN